MNLVSAIHLQFCIQHLYPNNRTWRNSLLRNITFYIMFTCTFSTLYTSDIFHRLLSWSILLPKCPNFHIHICMCVYCIFCPHVAWLISLPLQNTHNTCLTSSYFWKSGQRVIGNRTSSHDTVTHPFWFLLHTFLNQFFSYISSLLPASHFPRVDGLNESDATALEAVSYIIPLSMMPPITPSHSPCKCCTWATFILLTCTWYSPLHCNFSAALCMHIFSPTFSSSATSSCWQFTSHI